MKRFIKSKLILQVVVATLVTTLATAGIVIASTTINNNVSTGTITATGLSTLTSATLSTTLAVTGATTLSDDLTIDTSDLFVDISTDRIGVGSTTPWATLSIDTNAGDNAFVIGSSTATYLRVNTTGVLLGNESLGDSADLRWDGTTNTHLLFADVSAERVGIGSSTPFATLSVNTATGENALTIGSSTATYLRVNTLGVLLGNETLGDSADLRWDGTTNTHLLFADVSTEKVGIGSSTPYAQFSINADAAESALVIGSSTTLLEVNSIGNLLFDTNVLVGDKTNNKVGVASSTLFGQLSVGAGLAGTGAATSTISTGRFCMYAGQENGENVYVYLSDSAPNRQPFATSSTSCF